MQAIVRQLEATMEESDFEQAEQLIGRLERTDSSAAEKWRAELAQRRGARNSFATVVSQLDSRDEAVVARATEQLRLSPTEVQPLLLKAIHAENSPVMVGHAMRLIAELYPGRETMRRLTDVLESPAGRKNWSDAVRAIQEIGGDGAGDRLLDLALQAPNPRQRSAGLRSLAAVDDPPPHTLIALLPAIFANASNVDLPLRAAARAAFVHGQFDLESRQGIPLETLDEKSEKQLERLPDYLKQLMQEQDTLVHRKRAQAARQLATVLGIVPAEPLSQVQVASFTQQVDGSPASALLDGVWNSTEPQSMWRHAVSEPGEVVVDLGAVRTLVGIRVWNLNEADRGSSRGWKDVEIAIGESPGRPRIMLTAFVPQAPGRADSADYSTFIPLPFPKGRYVTLRALSVWSRDSHSGLSEIQLFGF